jgi:hypothetical protein
MDCLVIKAGFEVDDDNPNPATMYVHWGGQYKGSYTNFGQLLDTGTDPDGYQGGSYNS